MTRYTVRDVMSDEVATVVVDAPLATVATLLGRRRISGVPVLDGEDRVVGVVTVNDLLHTMTGHQDTADVRARDLMTAPAVTIDPDASIVEAAAKLEDTGVGRLPVVDRDGSLVGVVSRGDLVKVFTRPDEHILGEITEDVVADLLLIPPELLTITVTDGVVTLRGHLEKRSQATQLVALSRRVDGVARVVDELSHGTNDAGR
ncbi:CBS domain-containing protein [Cryptosporangium arvum]|uniref:CBS-domain-containing membrane protein n=1 Tax=Cryptosporangium arvum DSM 44712 TaxID=927661 RepID=A0A010Z522_9ACTN|nr:CBS domain-containing protein [Cryptosporangium arvum]EXG82448.1 CBS-domain-containing membrane protein [Cryptosporangium arvum DSM 44712]